MGRAGKIIFSANFHLVCGEQAGLSGPPEQTGHVSASLDSLTCVKQLHLLAVAVGEAVPAVIPYFDSFS